MLVHFPAQAGNHADALGLGLAWGQNSHGIENVAVAIDVTAEDRSTREIAGRVGYACTRINVAQDFACGGGAAAVSLDVLEARIDGQDQAVREREARAQADVARVRRIIATVKFRTAAGTQDGRSRSIGHASLRGIDLAREVDQVLALISIGREAVAAGRTDGATGVKTQRQRTEEVVAVLVPVARQRDEIITRQRLIDPRVVLLLVDLAVVVERVVIGGAAGRNKGAQPAGVQIAGFDLREEAAEIKLASRTRQQDIEVTVWTLRAQVDGAAGSRSGRAVDVGGAKVDVDLLDQFRIDLLVRIDGVVA